MNGSIAKLPVYGLFVCVFFGAGARTVFSHHTPEDVITHLSASINADGRDAKLLVRRADQWRILGKSEKAIADYQQALKLDPSNRIAYHGLARTQISQNCYQAAIATAQHGIALGGERDLLAPLHALVAIAQGELGNHDAALVAWTKAIECEKPEVDWLLQHARTLQVLEKQVAARNALASAKESNPSVVLHRAWIDALIRCKDYELAAAQIEIGMQRCRWKSSWLLQRAELRFARGEYVLARSDASAAHQEISKRMVQGVENPILEEQLRHALKLLKNSPGKS